MKKKFILKLSIFALVVFIIQYFLPLPKDVQWKIRQVERIGKMKIDLLFMGDSTIKWIAPNDALSFSIAEILNDQFPGQKTVNDSGDSSHIDVYNLYGKYYLKNGLQTRMVIFPLNMSSFGPEWDKHPLWQFEEDIALFPLMGTMWVKYYKPLSVFKYAGQKYSFQDYDNIKIYKEGKYIGRMRELCGDRIKDFSPENADKKLAMRYMYLLGGEHSKLRSLRSFIRTLKEHDVIPVVYTTPIDYESGVHYCGRGFADQLHQNVGVIKSVLKEEGVPLLDLSMLLSTEYFSWREDIPDPVYPNEHLKFEGRFIVAKTLANYIKGIGR